MLINCAILFAIYVAFGLNINIMPYSYICLLMINVYMVLQSRKNFLLFIVFFIILFSNYSIIYSNFIVRLDDSMFTDILSERTRNVSINTLTLFNLMLFFFVRWSAVHPLPCKNIFIDHAKQDKVITLLLSIILIVVFFVGFQIPEKEGERGTSSPLYEYSVFFFILYFLYSGGGKKEIYWGLFLVFAYSMQNFIFGGRIYGLQFVLATYIMVFMHRFSMAKVLFAIAVVFILFSIIGAARGELLSGNFDVQSILLSIFQRGFALDTAYSAYFTSTTFVYLDERVDLDVHAALFLDFIKSIFVGSGSNPDSVLPQFSLDYVTHYFGGLLPFYLYFYLGSFGILLAALLLAFYLNILISLTISLSNFWKCIMVWIVSTTFRWYLYSPLPLLRGVLLFVIVYYVFAYFHYMLNRLPLRKKSYKWNVNNHKVRPT